MLKREESIELQSDTDSSTDHDNPFNEYVQIYKKSAGRAKVSVQPTLPNTNASNISTPQHTDVLESEKGPQSQNTQTEFKQDENEKPKLEELGSSSNSITLLQVRYHEQQNLISLSREDINYWQQKVRLNEVVMSFQQCFDIESQIQFIRKSREERASDKKQKNKEQVKELKERLTSLIEQNDQLKDQISERGQILNEIHIQIDDIDQQKKELETEINESQTNNLQKQQKQEQEKYQEIVQTLYSKSHDINFLTYIAVSIQAEIKKIQQVQ